MATPVPVVSRMNFLLSTPPNVFAALKPAFTAWSTKYAIFFGSVSGERSGVCVYVKATSAQARRITHAATLFSRRGIFVTLLPDSRPSFCTPETKLVRVEAASDPPHSQLEGDRFL